MVSPGPSNSMSSIMMRNKHLISFGLMLILSSIWTPISVASVVSTGNFNKDFFITWAPTQINTWTDGKTRSFKLDQEPGSFKIINCFILINDQN